jgi:hypothetical protein
MAGFCKYGTEASLQYICKRSENQPCLTQAAYPSCGLLCCLVHRTPLHCAASCNNLAMVRFLVEHGACIFATTLSDHETAAEKCEEDEEGFDGCSEYLYSK